MLIMLVTGGCWSVLHEPSSSSAGSVVIIIIIIIIIIRSVEIKSLSCLLKVARSGSGGERAACHQQRAEQCRDVWGGRDPQLPSPPLYNCLLRRSGQSGAYASSVVLSRDHAYPTVLCRSCLPDCTLYRSCLPGCTLFKSCLLAAYHFTSCLTDCHYTGKAQAQTNCFAHTSHPYCHLCQHVLCIASILQACCSYTDGDHDQS